MMQGEIPPKLFYHSSVTWKIKNAFYRWPDMNNTIVSPEFETHFNVPVKWRLTLCVRQKFGKEYKTVIYLGSRGYSGKPLSCFVTAILEFTDITGKKHEPAIERVVYKKLVKLDFSFPFIADQEATYFKEKLPNSGEFTIKCDLFLDTNSSEYWSNSSTDLSVLSFNLDTFYLAENLTDLVLHVGDEKFHVHSTIVKLRSPYVAGYLATNSGNQDVSFEGMCSGDQLKDMIRYWYSGDFYKVPKYLLSEAPNFVQKMKQEELQPYLSCEKISAFTTFGKINISLNWVIVDDKYFRELQSLKNKEVSQCIGQQSWKLHFYPKGETGKSKHISLCVEEEGEITSTRPAYLKIFIRGVDGNEYGDNNTILELHSTRKYVFRDFMPLDEFTKQLPILLLDKKLSIECRIEYGTGESKEDCKCLDVSNPGNVGAIKHPYEILVDKLKKLLEFGEMSDVTLVTKDGKSRKAHSAILAARSRYFELYLRNLEPDAWKHCVIKLCDIESGDLELILKYMYHAERHLDLQLAHKLYTAVHKYRVYGLDYLISAKLQGNLNVDSSLEILDMADKSQDWSLKKTSLEFIVKNFGEISMTEKWQRFQNSNPKLASEIEDQRRLVQSNPE